MRNTNEQNIKDVIKDMFSGSKIESKLKEAELIHAWPELVGEMISKQTEKMYIKNGKLYIHIQSAPLRNELHFSRARIVDIVNDHAQLALISEVVIL